MNIQLKINQAKIKIVLLASVVMWILVFSQLIISVMCEKRISIKEAFATGDEVHIEKYTGEVVSKLGDISYTELIEKIMECNGCKDYETVQTSSSVTATGTAEKYIISITIKYVKNTDDAYIHYTISNIDGSYYDYMPDECFSRTENTMLLLKKYNMNSVRYTQLTGTIKQELTESMCKQQTANILNKMNAALISSHYDREYTVYAYSPNLSETITSKGKKINLQLYFTYNEITKNTEITVATPIVR